jgi:hypothetical protein
MARIKDVKADNPNYVIDLIDILAKNDPSKTNKYLPFMVSQTKDWLEWFVEELSENTFKEMFQVVKDFDDLSERNLLENKDIYSYENNEEIVDEIKLAREKVTRSEVKKKETVVVHEDDRWVVIQPLTSRSSNVYGKSTKWCVASDDHNFKKYFNDYTKEGVLVFVIDKTIKDKDCRDNVYSKVAFHKYSKDDMKGLTIWDSKDKQLGVGEMMELYGLIPMDIIKVVNETLVGEANQEIGKKRGVKAETY